MLPEIPSLCFLETNGNHTQKDGAKPGKSSGEHEKPPTTQKIPKQCQAGIKVDTS